MISSEQYDSLANRLGNAVARTDAADIAAHSYDSWPLATKWKMQGKQPYKPEIVVYASAISEIAGLLSWATENGVAVTPWGAGSSVTGSPLPLQGGVTLDLSHMDQVLNLNQIDLTVTVQAGIMGDVLERAMNEHGYTLNHSPQSLDRSTVGGWVATRATGQFSSRWGGIEELVVGLKVVLPTGEVIEVGHTPRASMGPDLRSLFIGSEGTLGTVAEVTLRIFPIAPFRRLEAVRFDSVEAGIQVMRQIMQIGLRPFLVRFYDQDESRHAMQDKAFEGCTMFLGAEGLVPVAEAEYAAMIAFCLNAGGEVLGSAAVEAWMKRRFDFSTVEHLLALPGGYAETIEIAHTWSQILAVYTAMKHNMRPVADEVLGHFSHLYSHGTSLYLILLGRAEDDSTAEQRIQRIWELAMRTALDHDAVLSHHHGVGLARLPYIRRSLGERVKVLDRVKMALDPASIMSPGKLGL